MEMYAVWPITLSSVPVVKEVLEAWDLIEVSPAREQWEFLRQEILKTSVSAHWSKLRAQLSQTNPGYADLLDEHVDEIRQAKKVIPAIRPADIESLQAGGDYIYWRYSRDVLGKPEGLTNTSIERQFGIRHGTSCHLKVAVSCPLCGAKASCKIDCIPIEPPFSLELTCESCQHREDWISEWDKGPSRLLCPCSSCREHTSQAAIRIQPLVKPMIDNISEFILREVDRVVDTFSLRTPDIQTKAIRQDRFIREFCEAVVSNPTENLFNVFRRIIFGNRSDSAYHVAKRIAEAAVYLTRNGILEAEVEVLERGEQSIVDSTLHGLAARISREGSQEDEFFRRVDTMKTLVRGFNARSREEFKNWALAFEDIGIGTAWFELPLDVRLSTRDYQIKAILAGKAPDQASPTYPKRLGYLQQASERSIAGADPANLLDLVNQISRPALSTQVAAIYSEVTKTLREEISEALKKELQELDGGKSKAEAISKSLQNRGYPEVLQKRDEFRDVGIRYAYWTFSSESGIVDGVRISDICRCAGGLSLYRFREVIKPVSMPWECPMCNAQGVIHEILLSAQKHISGEFSCPACKHNETFSSRNGVYYRNEKALECPCQWCKSAQDSFFIKVRDASSGWATKICDTIIADISEDAPEVTPRGSLGDNEVTELLALGISKGYPPTEAAAIAFANTGLNMTWGATWGANAWGPEWLRQACLYGLGDLGDREMLIGDAGREYIATQLAEAIFPDRKGLTFEALKEIEIALKSEDRPTILGIIAKLRESRFPKIRLPVRYEVKLNQRAMLETLSIARRESFGHISGKPMPLEDVQQAIRENEQTWPDEAAETVRTTCVSESEGSKSEDESRAVELLKRLGYEIFPPKH